MPSLSLDKAAVEEPINRRLQEVGHHDVRVGLEHATKEAGVPTLKIFSSMGGGRNSASNVVDFGGSDSKKAGGDNLPKEFEYRKEDFMPLSAQSSTSQQ